MSRQISSDATSSRREVNRKRMAVNSVLVHARVVTVNTTTEAAKNTSTSVDATPKSLGVNLYPGKIATNSTTFSSKSLDAVPKSLGTSVYTTTNPAYNEDLK